MSVLEKIITDNLPLWSSSVQLKSTRGRGSSSKRNLYGIKKLRELILDLAVRGLLVPQDPNDEPASALLEKIEVEKNKLITDGKISKPRKANSSGELTLPFKLPNGWAFSKLADIGHDWGQKKPDQQFTYIDVGAINKELGIVEKQSILDNSEAPSRARKIVRQGTVIFSTVRPYLLNIAVINKDFTPEPIASTAFAIIHPFNGISSSYIYRYLRSPVFASYVEDCQTGIAYPAINDKQFFSGLIALPPSAEQHRIVAKVDELMALCDTLEQQQENSIEAHETLVETLFSALTNAPDAEAFQSAWERVSKHFDTLLTTEHSVNKLKETILQLAVMGKLVPQDPNDEPASVLLEKIIMDKERLIENGQISKPKNISDFGKYKAIGNWVGCKFGDIYHLEYGNGLKKSERSNTGEFPVFGSNGIVGTHNKSRVKSPCIIIGRKGSAGALNLSDTKECWVTDVAYSLAPSSSMSLKFVFYQLHTLRLDNLSKGIKPGLNRNEAYALSIQIPPLAEQHRIVAKVDELMALCDDLKQSLNEAQTTQMQLTDAVLENAF
ncbi:restriction endonuclease subunit S [Pseudomonadales bacterium]|nr:restriction endonuclease subunit S [Pseudomonadales bacterium]